MKAANNTNNDYSTTICSAEAKEVTLFSSSKKTNSKAQDENYSEQKNMGRQKVPNFYRNQI